MTKPIATVFASVLIAAMPAAAQTTTELLQKGIYAQETEGNLDNAILIYRQIVNSAPAQRDIAAQAQYRLAQALLQKGDLTTASKEFERLARDYSEYGGLVSSLAGQMRPAVAPGGRGGRGIVETDRFLKAEIAELTAKLADLRVKHAPGHPEVRALETQLNDLKSKALFTEEFDPSKPVTLAGTLSRVMWINPRAWLKIDGLRPEWTFMLAAPNAMVQTGKVTRDTFQPGMKIEITGVGAKDGSQTVRADTISSDGKVIFDRTWLAPAP